MDDRKEKNGAWLSVPQFGDWDQKGPLPDYSMDFSKIREMRKQNKRDPSRASLGNEEELISSTKRNSDIVHQNDHHENHSPTTEARHKLSLMDQLVVSTGGGAVVRPINWRHMKKGITVWLDVPLIILAQRITAIGTGSRPLLYHESGDPYSKTLKRLSTLYEERGKVYANADARVSFEKIAGKLGLEDVCDITHTAIAIEALL